MIIGKAISQLGWVYFSRDALRKAEARLRAEQEGVRDEIGFLLLHQAYADRFFPGTSVLQTRLRYIFFVPWIYLDLMKSFRGGNFERELTRKEVELTARLKHNKEGVIGSRSYPKPTSQPASMVYWTALGTWGFLRKLPDGDLPYRSKLHHILSAKRATFHIHDDDGEPLDNQWRVFVNIPAPPDEWWEKKEKLEFRLRDEEKEFLIKHLVALPQKTGNGNVSLLARLVDQQIPVAELNAPWEDAALEIAAENDRRALITARRAAALAAIGRGIYAALVECALERDGVSTNHLHRDALKELVDEYRAEAMKLDIQNILSDFPELKGKRIIGILEETKAWLAEGSKTPILLQPCYEAAEFARKGPIRAKLTNTPFARERRQEWNLNKGKKSEPLHYRWRNVQRLLMDLQEKS